VRKVQVLVQLQRVDTALDRARERLSAVHAELADSSALAQLTAEQEAARADLQRKAAQQRDLELEVEDLRDKLAIPRSYPIWPMRPSSTAT
jgi:predicted  nucleic acid-binding Zn-ribbon protein